MVEGQNWVGKGREPAAGEGEIGSDLWVSSPPFPFILLVLPFEFSTEVGDIHSLTQQPPPPPNKDRSTSIG